MANEVVWISRGQGLAFSQRSWSKKSLGGFVRNATFAEQKATMAALLGGVI